MKTKPIVVEYLIIFLQEGTFCDSEAAFLKFLDVDSSISISGGEKTITFKTKKKGDFSISYSLISGLVPSQEQRYFKLTLSSKENKLAEYTELTNLLEKLILKLHEEVSINVLWNDISRKYAIEGYALINEVENLLRRLITNFMLINVGYDWHKYHVPNSVNDRESHLKESYSDYLHQTYFSDLKTILFEGQREFGLRNIGEVQKFVERCISERKTEIPTDELKGVISKSLWEKHFAKDNNYKKNDLEEDLEKLNSLRNEIAHNRHINRETLGKITSLSKKIIKALKLEIEDLPNKVLTPKQQKFQVNTETIRLLESELIMSGYLSEKIIIEWYRTNFVYKELHREVMLPSDKWRRDIVIKTKDNKYIGVEVKSTNLMSLKKIKNLFRHRVLDKFLPKNTDLFKEFHIVYIIRDFSIDSDLSSTNELTQFFKEVNSKIKLIFGFINDENIFEQL